MNKVLLFICLASCAIGTYLLFSYDSTEKKVIVSKEKKNDQIAKQLDIKPTISKKKKIYFGYQPGDHFSYKLTYDIAVKSKEELFFAINISGVLHLKIYQKTPHRFTIAYYMESPKVALGVKKAAKMFEEALEKKVYVSMDHYGKVEQLYFPSSMREELANNMKSIIASSQVVLDKKKRKQWKQKKKI